MNYVTTQITIRSYTPASVPLSSWLFIRDSESIWVEHPFGTTLILAGPGPRREQRDFISQHALEAFQIELAERLAGDGWILWGYDRDRRSGTDRRSTPRPAPDRRRVLQFRPPAGDIG
jgi:hypothetical protein